MKVESKPCTIAESPNMHHESELTRQKTEEDLAQADDDVSTESDTITADQRSTEDVFIVNFQPGEPADPHNWSTVRFTDSRYIRWKKLIFGRPRKSMLLLWDLCYLS